MYDDILREIFALNKLENPASQSNYLQSIRPIAKRLWHAYQTQVVAVDYSEPKIQEAYLLRYFVPYSFLLSTVLGKMVQEGIDVSRAGGLLTACLFGCGPGPEVAGLISYLKQNDDCPEMLIIRMLDAASATWHHGRTIVRNSIVAAEWDPALIEMEQVALDISEELPFPSGDADLVVFQNCLNELNASQLAMVTEKLRALLLSAKNGATLVLIERARYPTKGVLSSLYQWANQKAGFLAIGEFSRENVLPCDELLAGIPEIVKHLYYVYNRGWAYDGDSADGLILAKGVPYIWLAISKRT